MRNFVQMIYRKPIFQVPVLIWGICLTACLCFWGCGNQNPGNIPNVPVDITLNIFDPSFQDLQGVGGYAFIPGGSRGIVVYRVSIDQFNAYERHCTYDADNPCGKVSLDESGVMLVDDDCNEEGCGSKFNIIDGSVIQGPALYPLLQYNTYFDGVVLRIYN